ncbi:MAG: putative haloacid dehalogenase-like hydrolase [Acidimicrobiales bacterium]|nr:putative haloacid dehalogenase-like hydrolase [Acidimicrobiales bacterium]
MTEAACFELENEVLRSIGREPMTRELHRSTWGMPLLHAMLERSPGVDLAEFSRVCEVALAAHVDAGRLDVLPEEHLDVLDQLIAHGYTVMLLTSRTESEIRHLIAPEHPLTKRLARVYHADNSGELKPSPRVFDRLLADAGVAPQQCVYVGDSPGDAAAATGAGLRFIASLQSGIRGRSEFATFRVDAFVDHFSELVEVIRALR